MTLKASNDIPWNVRLDASVDPVCVVFAPRWFDARHYASCLLNAHLGRVHVSQFNEREMREYEMPRAMPAWKAAALDAAQARIMGYRMVLGKATRGRREPGCNTCGGTPPVSGLTCVCGGTGLQRDEINGLRRAIFAAEERVHELEDSILLREAEDAISRSYGRDTESVRIATDIRRRRGENWPGADVTWAAGGRQMSAKRRLRRAGSRRQAAQGRTNVKLTAIFMATVDVPDAPAGNYDEQEKALFRAMAARILNLFGLGATSAIDCSRSIGCVGPITDDVRAFTLAVLNELEAASTPVLPAPLPAKKDSQCN